MSFRTQNNHGPQLEFAREQDTLRLLTDVERLWRRFPMAGLASGNGNGPGEGTVIEDLCASYGCSKSNVYQITMSGVGPAPGAGASGACFVQFNRTWSMKFDGTSGLDCLWWENIAVTPACTVPGGGFGSYSRYACRMAIGDPYVNVFFTRGSAVGSNAGSAGAFYSNAESWPSTPSTTINCNGGYTLYRVPSSLSSSTSPYASWPATIVLNKA